MLGTREKENDMAFIELLAAGTSEDAAREIFAAETDRFGYTPNFARAFARRPAVYTAWTKLNGAIKATMDERRYELVTVAAARQLRSSYCMLVHGRLLAERHLDAQTVIDLAAGRPTPGLDPADAAVIDLATKIAGDATSVSEADVERLRALGLTDDEIFDVIAAAAVRCFFSKALDALGLNADAELAAIDSPLREALTVGRPIASLAHEQQA